MSMQYIIYSKKSEYKATRDHPNKQQSNLVFDSESREYQLEKGSLTARVISEATPKEVFERFERKVNLLRQQNKTNFVIKEKEKPQILRLAEQILKERRSEEAKAKPTMQFKRVAA